MADDQMKKPIREAIPRGLLLTLYILLAASTAIAGFSIATLLTSDKPVLAENDTSLNGQAAGEGNAASHAANLEKLVYSQPPKPMPDIAFTDAADKPHGLSEWKGKVVLLNLWATWCAPCKLEMPSLNRLQAKMGGDDFAVLAISLDRSGVAKPEQFLKSNALSELDLYIDRTSKLITQLQAPGLPLTLILNRDGEEVARLAGPAAWDHERAEAIIQTIIDSGNNSH